VPRQDNRVVATPVARSIVSSYDNSTGDATSYETAPRVIHSSPRLARQAAVRRCRLHRPEPPTLSELIGTEVEQNPFLYSFVELGEAIRAESSPY
jgi:hypothetical protein